VLASWIRRGLDLSRKKLAAARGLLADSFGASGRSMVEYCDYLLEHLAPAVFDAVAATEAFGSQLQDCHQTRDFGIRFVYYPAHTQHGAPSLRCGEHLDSSTFTVIIQDAVGGLQVKVGSQWQDLRDPALVMTGSVGEILSNQRLRAVLHRVVDVDVGPGRLVPARVSIAVFVDADDGKPLNPHLQQGEQPLFQSGLTKSELKQKFTEDNLAKAEKLPGLQGGSRAILSAKLLSTSVPTTPLRRSPP